MTTPQLPAMPSADEQDPNQELNASLTQPVNAQSPTAQNALQKPLGVPTGTPMISPDLKDMRYVPSDQQADAASIGWENVTHMVHPTTKDKRWVPSSQVSDALQAGYVNPEVPAASAPSTPFSGLGSAAKETAIGAITPQNAVQAYHTITEDIPAVYKAYEAARSTGASISDAYTAAQSKAQEISDAKNGLTQAVKQFQTNPNKAAWNAVLQLGTVALGGELAGVPEAAETAEMAETAVPEAVAESKPAGIVQQVLKGEKVAQPQAQAALRTGAGSTDTSISLRKVMQPSVDKAFTESKSLYKPIDEAAGTDFRGLYDRLDAAMDRERLTAAGSPEQAKAELDIKNTQDAINDAKETVKKAGIPDVDKAMQQADTKFTEAQANKDLNAKLFNNQSVVKGNLKYGAPETIDVDRAIDALENLDKPNKYGASRLRQTSLGDAGTDKLLQDLYDAQRLGQKAVSKQKFAKWAGGLLGVGTAEEVLRHTLK
jgi:hypothetical protein